MANFEYWQHFTIFNENSCNGTWKRRNKNAP